jgi:enoyl-CoA hydratase/carnithine racemase
MSTEEPSVLYSVEDGIGTLTINRPRLLNAINVPTCHELFGMFDEAAADASLRVLIVTGAGGRSFSSGADLSDERPSSMEGTWNRMMLGIARFPVPTIAAVDGVAVGAGLSLALACDMRVVAEGSRMGAVFVRRGLMPDTGATYLMPRLTGPDQALKLLLTGRLIDAAEAARLGLATELAPQGEALPTALALAKEIVAAAPLPVARTRRLLHDGFVREFEEGLATELPLVLECLETKDALEGMRAFVEKRAPVWVGE